MVQKLCENFRRINRTSDYIQKLENVEILEIDGFLRINTIYIDRNRNKILGHCP